MSGSLDRMRAWRPVLRFAGRDARRHLARTSLAALLIALPVAGLVGYLGFSGSSTPSREVALASIPDGVQAVLTATALPRGGVPFPQLPEGASGPWADDPEVIPPGREELARRLAPGSRLLEYWRSPELIISPELGLHPGEQRVAGDGADRLAAISLDRLAVGRLDEADPQALPLLAPRLFSGELPGGPDEVLVSAALAERLGLAVGDALGFLAAPDTGWRSTEGNTAAAMQNSQRGYRVSGIADDAGLQAWAPAGWLSMLVAEHPQGIQGHWLVVGEEPVTWQQARSLNELQAFAVSRQVLTHYPPAAELYPVALDGAALVEAAIGVTVAALLGGLLVFFLITPAFAVSTEQLRRSLGLASAAGAAPRDLRRIVLAQGLVLGAVGGAVGSVLGTAAAFAFTAWAETAAHGVAGVGPRLTGMFWHFPWWTLVLGVLLAIALGAVAALPPAVSASRLVPVDALRDRRPPRPVRGRAARTAATLAGPLLLALGFLSGVLGLVLPVPGPTTDPGAPPPVPGTMPAGSGFLQLLTVAAVSLSAAGVVLVVRSVVSWFGGLGRRSGPAIRLALRDGADHPSRTLPAALGVLFAIAAASFSTVQLASAIQDGRDNGAVMVEGTLAIGARVPVVADFDRLVVRSAVVAASGAFPEIVGSQSVTSPTYRSSVHLAPILPAGVTCGPDEAVHLASAVQPGVPVRCTGVNSAAAFHGGLAFPSWLGSNTVLMSPDAMRATRLPGAEQAARVLERGGVVVGNAALQDGDGRIRVAVSAEFLPTEADADRVVILPGAFVRGLGGPLVTTPETAAGLGVDDVDYLGEILVTTTPLSFAEVVRVRAYLEKRSPLFFVGLPDDPSPVGNVTQFAPILLLALVAVASTAVAVLLSATQGRRDVETMHAVGADRGLLRRLGLARAGLILAVGTPAGIVAGLALGAYQVAWNRRLEASGAWLETVPAWGLQLGLAVGIVAIGLLSAIVLARPPRRFVRRGLD